MTEKEHAREMRGGNRCIDQRTDLSLRHTVANTRLCEATMWFHIVDNEPVLREIIESLVTVEGYKAASFKSAEAYLVFFNSPQYIEPVAIIIDNRMAGMSGMELVRAIRKRAPSQRLVIATATPTDIKTVKPELCYVLPKPFKYQQLKTMLRELVACMKTYEGDSICFKHEICRFGLGNLCSLAIRDEV